MPRPGHATEHDGPPSETMVAAGAARVPAMLPGPTRDHPTDHSAASSCVEHQRGQWQGAASPETRVRQDLRWTAAKSATGVFFQHSGIDPEKQGAFGSMNTMLVPVLAERDFTATLAAAAITRSRFSSGQLGDIGIGLQPGASVLEQRRIAVRAPRHDGRSSMPSKVRAQGPTCRPPAVSGCDRYGRRHGPAWSRPAD